MLSFPKLPVLPRFKKGAVGIGTLIIFIAMVLVAAIAAAVLISTSGILQQRAMATGKESIAQVSSNLVVVSITGYADPTLADLSNVSIAITAASGAGRIDVRYLILRVSNSENESYLSYSPSSLSNGTFTASALRDPSNLFSATNPVIDSSSLIRLWFLTSSQSPPLYFPPRMRMHLELIPEHGATITIDTIMPASYSTSVVNVYP
ncbi:MAG: archaellin/type IV pilin N-terminal domain-containing protein [Candidatus Micrarchaeota archaeon]